ncbi:hypothetical protein RRG08_020218 [Elysia crispata]|uniref:Uncharacterized protein n=1 Tax=Elysia crispata TaxID=231223 RepID=A0AAE1A225_9GAST|nr:hypothetical protein RRG08_020218 [Elysia crispata]
MRHYDSTRAQNDDVSHEARVCPVSEKRQKMVTIPNFAKRETLACPGVAWSLCPTSTRGSIYAVTSCDGLTITLRDPSSRIHLSAPWTGLNRATANQRQAQH